MSKPISYDSSSEISGELNIPVRDHVGAECLVPLQGVFNFRDMGGLQASDGRTVKKGILFRAAELTGLTADDHVYLNAIGIKHVIDYRNRAEAERKPDPQIGQATMTRIAASQAADDLPHPTMEEMFKSGRYKMFTAEMLTAFYSELPIGNASYKHLMKLLRSPEQHLPLIHHCAGGRDRTGVGSMLILMTLGVPYETVMEDYLLSNATLAEYHSGMYGLAARYVSEAELDRLREAMKLQERYLDASMARIRRAYGTFDRYIEAEFGIDGPGRRRIQDYCLE